MAKFYRNKLNLGGIKVPFDLERDEDSYQDASEQMFHCSVFTRSKKIGEIITQLESAYGELNYHLIFSEGIEFYFAFKKEKSGKALKGELERYGGCKLENSEDCQILLQTVEKHQSGVRHSVLANDAPDMNGLLNK